MPTDPPRRLYRYALSGHCHRVQLLLSLLNLPCELVDVDLAKGEHRQPAFLAKNPLGQVPVLEEGGVCLADSNAILVYLAIRHDPVRRWYPEDPLTAARVQQWLTMAAGALFEGPASARLATLFRVPLDVERARTIAAGLLARLDHHLAGRRFLVEPGPTLADLALYTYTAHAPEGGIALSAYPHVCAWIERVESLEGFVPMTPATA